MVTNVDLRQVYDEEMGQLGEETGRLVAELGRIHTQIAMHQGIAGNCCRPGRVCGATLGADSRIPTLMTYAIPWTMSTEL